jgi:hypothetical protein
LDGKEVMVECLRGLHNEELNILYFSSKIIRSKKSRKMPHSDHVARMEEKWNEDTGLVGKLEERRPRRRWKDTMKMVS